MAQRFGCYVNLTRGGFSICLLKTDRSRGPVVAHARAVALSDVRCIVSEGGRVRSVNKAKEVHAWLAGELLGFEGTATEAGKAMGLDSFWTDAGEDAAVNNTRRVRYNPSLGGAFFLADTGEHVDSMATVFATDASGVCRVYTAD